MRIHTILSFLLITAFVSACKHPLEPIGEGDIISVSGNRNCLLEDYQSFLPSCDSNIVTADDGDYVETYIAQPRSGWKFVRWENYCEDAVINECSWNIPASFLAFASDSVPPLRAIFAPLPFTPTLSAPPSQISSSGADFAADISYGPDVRNVFDILMPPAIEPTPLVIFIHGGGFVGGNKSSAYTHSFSRNVGEMSLINGVAYATVNYRFLQASGESEGVIKSLSDVRRALQYIRLNAESFNIDPNKIAVFGTSAGAGTSLWLGTHDDMADTRSVDPVDRMSSRVVAAGAGATQATYDIVGWETVFSEFFITLELIAQAAPGAAELLLDFYGIGEMSDLFNDPDIVAYRADVDMLGLMDAQDAPIWVNNPQTDIGFPLGSDSLFHHGFHARELRDRAEAVGLENQVYVQALGIADPSGEDLATFFLRHLGVTP